MNIRERYKFLRHLERLLMWQINQVEQERAKTKRILRRMQKQCAINRAVLRVVQANREYLAKIVVDSRRR